jgi:hypothetical protein
MIDNPYRKLARAVGPTQVVSDGDEGGEKPKPPETTLTATIETTDEQGRPFLTNTLGVF